MTSRTQTIQIVLPTGDPRGIRVAEITTRIVRVIEVLRSQLITEGVLAEQPGSSGALLVFTRDHLFPSPSTAAMAVMGRSANGWVEWKTTSGKTLDEIKRQGVTGTGNN